LKVSFNNIKPFVRYARFLDKDMRRHSTTMCGYDGRLLYCTDGEGCVEIDGKEYGVREGTLLIWNSGVKYRYCTETNPTMRFIAVNFDYFWDNSNVTVPIPPEKVETFDASKRLENPDFSDAVFFNSPIVLHNMFCVQEKLSEINREYFHSKAYGSLYISGIMASVLAEAASCSNLQLSGTKSIVDRIISYLQSNYTEDISNKLLGEKFGYHPNYLNSLFAEYTGKSLHRYLQDLRIMQALALLQDTDLSVSEISAKVGFRDFPHFSRAVKKKTGYPPSRFRT